MKKLLLTAILLISASAQAEYIYSDFWDLFLVVRQDIRSTDVDCVELNQKIDKLIEINADLPEWRQKNTARMFENQIWNKNIVQTCYKVD